MKKIVLSVFALGGFVHGIAQQQGKFRVGLDAGYAIPASGGGGVLLSIEPKYNIKDNMNVGVRFGIAGMARDVQENSYNSETKVSSNMSYLATYDYYFNNGGGAVVPYVGLGAGLYTHGNIEFHDNANRDVSFDIDAQFGGMIRGGFEWNKFRMGVEYNIVPKSDLKNISGVDLGSSPNSYLGIHIGFFVGGGKWNK